MCVRVGWCDDAIGDTQTNCYPTRWRANFYETGSDNQTFSIALGARKIHCSARCWKKVSSMFFYWGFRDDTCNKYLYSSTRVPSTGSKQKVCLCLCSTSVECIMHIANRRWTWVSSETDEQAYNSFIPPTLNPFVPLVPPCLE